MIFEFVINILINLVFVFQKPLKCPTYVNKDNKYSVDVHLWLLQITGYQGNSVEKEFVSQYERLGIINTLHTVYAGGKKLKKTQ